MIVKVLEESGYENSLLGLSLSYYDHKTPIEEWWSQDKLTKAIKRGDLLSHRQGGHNKFIESIQVWLYIQASRDFWQEFDTYRVGMSKNSSSTMHTLDKRAVDSTDFEEGTSELSIEAFNQCLLEYKDETSIYYKNVSRLKKNLPEGWLQERVVCTNYKCLQNIYSQRVKHRLEQWKYFTNELLNQLKYPNFVREQQ